MGLRVGWVGGSVAMRDHFPASRIPSYVIGGDRYFDRAVLWLARDQNEIEESHEDWQAGQFHGEGSIHPWGVNVARMMRWYARVKQWHFKLQADLKYADKPHYDETGDFRWVNGGSLRVEFDYWSLSTMPSRESQIPRYYLPSPSPGWHSDLPWASYDLSARFTYDGSSTNPNFADRVENLVVEAHMSNGFHSAITLFLQHARWGGFTQSDAEGENLFWPRVWCTVRSHFADLAKCTTAYDDGDDNPPNDAHIGTFQLDSLSTPLYGFRGLEEPSDGGQLYFNGIDVTITPKKFWPFATKKGLPVFDVDSGARLRDPFS
jgi:hypothetical protein